MIRAIIIDDEAYMHDEIKSRLVTYFPKDVAVVNEAISVASGLEAIQTFEPELLFLDVHMADGTGFDVIEKSENKNFNVIFITGYDTNAIKAIRVGALDYILKPIEDEEFKVAVQKAIDNKNKEQHLEKLITVSQNHYQGVDQKRIILKTTEAVYALQEKDIIYCEADGNYTTVYTEAQGKILVSLHMKKIEELLPPHLFIRCHQSYIVNKLHVLKYSKRGFLLLDTKAEVPVSARRKEFTMKNVF